MTEPEPLQQVDRTYVRFRQRKLSYFSGCDYFRLASHPRVIAALHTGVKKFGLNVAASRLTTGNHVIYRALEAELASFFDAESALLVSSGSRKAPIFVGAKFLMLNDSGAAPAKITTIPSSVLTIEGSIA